MATGFSLDQIGLGGISAGGVVNWAVMWDWVFWSIIVLMLLVVVWIVVDSLKYNYMVWIHEKTGDSWIKYKKKGRYTKTKDGKPYFKIRGQAPMSPVDQYYVSPTVSFLGINKGAIEVIKIGKETLMPVKSFMDFFRYKTNDDNEIIMDDFGMPQPDIIIDETTGKILNDGGIHLVPQEQNVAQVLRLQTEVKKSVSLNSFMQQYGAIVLVGGFFVMCAGLILLAVIMGGDIASEISSASAQNARASELLATAIENFNPAVIGGAP